MSERRPRILAGIVIPGHSVNARLVFGLIVIGLGVLFTLDNLGIADAGEILRWWPALLIAYGASRLTGFWSRSNVTAGAIFLVIGGWILFHNLGYVPMGAGVLWPLMLVMVGIAMVSGAMRRARGKPGGAPAEVGSRINAFAFWSASERKVVSPEFQGGDVTAIMGAHEIDLRSAGLRDRTAVIDLLVWMGGTELFIPQDWKVTMEAVAVMGAVQDQTRPPVGEPRGNLILRGLILMGGVEIRN